MFSRDSFRFSESLQHGEHFLASWMYVMERYYRLNFTKCECTYAHAFQNKALTNVPLFWKLFVNVIPF